MEIPNKLKKILQKDQLLNSLVLDIVNDKSFGAILNDNKLYFFDGYTEHGIEHIEKVLETVDILISGKLEAKEVAILILSIVLHDIGMHIKLPTFKAMIEGKYDDVLVETLDSKSWKELWMDYLSEVKHWDDKKRITVLGKKNKYEFFAESRLRRDNLKETDKLIIGEFIRRHHARLAHEIALKGLVGYDTNYINSIVPFGNDNLSKQYRQYIGIVARSHGMDIRDTFKYLEEIDFDAWKNPEGINIVFLMVILRIADVLQIDQTRTNSDLLKLKTIKSPESSKEHLKHLQTLNINFEMDDPELIFVKCNPTNAQLFVEIQDLIIKIQYELDLSWAILGEVYGLNIDTRLKYRRISSNLKNIKIKYVPKKIAFEVNNEVAKLLVLPLYGNNPSYGVRELVQNATDACKERMKIEQDKGTFDYNPFVFVSIDKINNNENLFKIIDNGVGMTLNEIQKYFLSVGSSFKRTVEWKKEFEGKVFSNGRFGIGVLAAFLLGNEISVKTRSYKEDFTYSFKARLDSEFVEIEKKIDNFRVGTTIKISMSNIKYDKIINNYHYNISFSDWYINDVPRVKFYINGFEKEKKYRFTSYREFKSKYYGKIQWAYLYSSEMNESKPEPMIVCNGILITLDSWNCVIQGSDVINVRPSLNIEDPQGKLPLRLDRTDLEKGELKFDNELLLDISKDFIAKLLTLPFDSTTIEKYEISPYKIEFLHFKNGFSLNSDYFLSRIKDRYFLLHLVTHSNKINNVSLIFEHFDKYVLYPIFNTYIDFDETKLIDIKGTVLLPKKKYIEIFRTEDREGLRQYYRWKHTHDHKLENVEWENDEYIVYNNDYKSMTNFFDFKNRTHRIKELGMDMQSVIETSFEDFIPINNGKILGQLFEKYFGKNVIIPYDMEERKRIYWQAFEELKDYIKDYEKFNNSEEEIT